MISLPAMIERAVRLNPNGIATSFAGRQHSWTEVQGRVALCGSPEYPLGFARKPLRPR